MQAVRQRLAEFLFPAHSDRWLSVLRTGLGLQVALYCLSLRSDWNYLFAGNGHGLITRELAEAILSVDSPLAPRLGWLLSFGSHLGVGEETILSLVWITLLCSGIGLLLGLFSRTSAAIAWLLHLCAVKSGGLVSYGVDNFTTIGLFYLMISPLPDRFSFDCQIRKWPAKPARLHGFYQRVLQLHLCIIYFFGGLAKCMGAGWWNGTSLWRALTRPPFNIISPEILLSWRYFLPLLGISVCLLETGYPFFIWMKKTRLIWLVGVCGMHLAIGFAMGMYLFALVMIVLNVAGFGADVFVSREAKDVSSTVAADGSTAVVTSPSD